MTFITFLKVSWRPNKSIRVLWLPSSQILEQFSTQPPQNSWKSQSMYLNDTSWSLLSLSISVDNKPLNAPLNNRLLLNYHHHLSLYKFRSRYLRLVSISVPPHWTVIKSIRRRACAAWRLLLHFRFSNYSGWSHKKLCRVEWLGRKNNCGELRQEE